MANYIAIQAYITPYIQYFAMQAYTAPYIQFFICTKAKVTETADITAHEFHHAKPGIYWSYKNVIESLHCIMKLGLFYRFGR